MADREKVIAGLMMLVDRKNDDTCEGLKCCKIAEDALALLKEQEPKPVKIIKNAYNHEFYYCPKCDRSFYETWLRKPKFCSECGQEVMWDDI